MMKSKILFSDALTTAIKITKENASNLGNEVVLVRDLKGRIRPVLQTRLPGEGQSSYARSLSAALGAYGFAPDRALLFKDEMGSSEELFAGRRKLNCGAPIDLYVLDRQISGQDWLRAPMARTSTSLRFTFHGLKGGVGRSTALVNWAWHLAEQGKKILVFDLDLESPGLSSTMLPSDHSPDFGIVDWFVEDGVGQADVVVPEMVANSPLASHLPGKILVVPAYGAKTGEYIQKLSRCYSDFSSEGAHSWAERLQRLVQSLEEVYRPDVVIFDSRAGLHDIAAVLVNRMDADTFLFAVDSRQTWDGYGMLFRYWQSEPHLLSAFRGRLQVVASMVPETGRDDYLKSFKLHAWDLFRDHLYDEVLADDVDGFSYGLDDEFAPHDPLPILWARALQEFDPAVGGIDATTAEIAFRLFYDRADTLLSTKQVESSHD